MEANSSGSLDAQRIWLALEGGSMTQEPEWNHVCRLAKNGNPDSDRRVYKTEAEWRQLLTPEQFQITRQHSTEAPYSNDMCAAAD
jgi:hypothetical protein